MDAASLSVSYGQFQITRYLHLAGATLAMYDHLICLPDEVEFIWKAPMGTIKSIYLFNRYSFPLLMILHFYDVLGVRQPSATFCRVWIALDSFWIAICFLGMHWFMTIRVWVFTGCRKPTFKWMVSAWFICSLLNLGILSAGVVQMIAVASRLTALKTCYHIVPRFLVLIWFPFFFLEIFLFVLTAIKYREHVRDRSNTPLMQGLWRDGYVYFLVLLLTSIFNIATWAVAPPMLKTLARHFCFSISVVSISRLILSLRRTSNKDPSEYPLSTIGPVSPDSGPVSDNPRDNDIVPTRKWGICRRTWSVAHLVDKC